MPKEYPWYGVVKEDAPLLQGDFITSCPIVIPLEPLISAQLPADVREYDVVILSQSCDLVQKKLEFVLLSPIWSLNELGERNAWFQGKEGKEALRKGNVQGYHLLNRCDLKGFESGHLVVDFRTIYSVPLDFLFSFAEANGERLRLLPPYREHLAQAFARFIMRVGLPVDIPQFE